MNPLDESLDYMDDTPVSPWPTILKYGGIGSLGIITLVILGFLINTSSTSYDIKTVVTSFAFTGLNIILYVLIMIFSIKEYRDKFSNGFISLGKGMLVSFGSALIMGIAGLLFNLLYLLVLNPGHMQRELEKSLGDSGLGPSAMTDVSDFYSPAFIAASQLGSFVIGCIAGIVLSLIISAIMKKDPPRFT